MFCNSQHSNRAIHQNVHGACWTLTILFKKKIRHVCTSTVHSKSCINLYWLVYFDAFRSIQCVKIKLNKFFRNLYISLGPLINYNYIFASYTHIIFLSYYTKTLNTECLSTKKHVEKNIIFPSILKSQMKFNNSPLRYYHDGCIHQPWSS